jgi:hypothetical protein
VKQQLCLSFSLSRRNKGGTPPFNFTVLNSHTSPLIFPFRVWCVDSGLVVTSSGNKGVFQTEKIIYYVPTAIVPPLGQVPAVMHD